MTKNGEEDASANRPFGGVEDSFVLEKKRLARTTSGGCVAPTPPNPHSNKPKEVDVSTTTTKSSPKDDDEPDSKTRLSRTTTAGCEPLRPPASLSATNNSNRGSVANDQDQQRPSVDRDALRASKLAAGGPIRQRDEPLQRPGAYRQDGGAGGDKGTQQQATATKLTRTTTEGCAPPVAGRGQRSPSARPQQESSAAAAGLSSSGFAIGAAAASINGGYAEARRVAKLSSMDISSGDHDQPNTPLEDCIPTSEDEFNRNISKALAASVASSQPTTTTPNPPPPSAQESCPGAFRQRPGWRRGESTSDEDDEEEGDISWGQNSTKFRSNTSSPTGTAEEADTDHSDLVQAMPLTLPTETAEPVDVNEAAAAQKERDDQRKRQGNKQNLYIGLVVFVLLGVVIVVGLVEFLVKGNGDESNSPSSMSSMGNGTMQETMEEELQPWVWDLPFSIPNSTLLAIQRGMDSSSDDDEEIPQYLAYQWMKKDPYLEDYSGERLQQRFVLATFYYAMDGTNWNHQGGGTIAVPTFEGELTDGSSEGIEYVNITSQPWLSYNHSECLWYSRAEATLDAKACNNTQHDGDVLTNLALADNNLQGTLPEEMFWLSNLEVITVGRNSIAGTISTSIGQLSNLRGLDLHRNRFTGTIPKEIGRLSNSLEFVIFLENQVTGQLPQEFWELSKLQTVKLMELDVFGTLPSDLGVTMPNLKSLLIPRTQMSGSLPTSLGLLSALEEVIMHNCAFTGMIPSQLAQATKLMKLFAPNNQFSGVLPPGLRSMKFVNFEGNSNITGPVEVLADWTKLKVMKLKGTGVTGTIPPHLCEIKKMEFDCSSSLCGCDDCPCPNSTEL